MARMADVRNAYTKDMVTTSPERLVTMLYDRLVRDLVAGEQAIEAGDVSQANDELQHAQAIVIELLHSLDVRAWPAAAELSSLYAWLIEQLLQANVRKDAQQVRQCREIVEPLAEAWHQAAARLATNVNRTVGNGSVTAVGAAV
jgi:flagellar protein FliS